MNRFTPKFALLDGAFNIVGENSALYKRENNLLRIKTAHGGIWGDHGRTSPAVNTFYANVKEGYVPYTLANSKIPNLTKIISDKKVSAEQAVHVDYTNSSLPWVATVETSVHEFDTFGEQAGIVLMGLQNDGTQDHENWIKLVLERFRDGKIRANFAISNAGSPRVVKKVELVGSELSSIHTKLALTVTNDLLVSAYVEKTTLADSVETDDDIALNGILFARFASYNIVTSDVDESALAMSTKSDCISISDLPRSLMTVPLSFGVMAHGSAQGDETKYKDACLINPQYGYYDTFSRSQSIMHALRFRHARADEISELHKIEADSYPSDEMASFEGFTYRQRVANDYFMVVDADVNAMVSYLTDNINAIQTLRPDINDVITMLKNTTHPTIAIAYICGTVSEGKVLKHETMSQHDATGNSLCIHSVCSREDFRKLNIAHVALKHYLSSIHASVFKSTSVLCRVFGKSVYECARDVECNMIEELKASNESTEQTYTFMSHVERILLLSKDFNTGLYVRAGFIVDGVSDVCHGQDTWMQCSYTF